MTGVGATALPAEFRIPQKGCVEVGDGGADPSQIPMGMRKGALG